MEPSIMLGVNVVSIILGQQMISSAISEASGSVYKSITNIFSHSDYVAELLTSLDIINKLQCMENILADIEGDHMYTKSIKMSSESIHNMILNIKADLQQIEYKIVAHKEKYFNKYRIISINEEVNALKLHCKLLDSRYDQLIKIINITQIMKPVSN
jgi:hypothetical protein